MWNPPSIQPWQLCYVVVWITHFNTVWRVPSVDVSFLPLRGKQCTSKIHFLTYRYTSPGLCLLSTRPFLDLVFRWFIYFLGKVRSGDRKSFMVRLYTNTKVHHNCTVTVVPSPTFLSFSLQCKYLTIARTGVDSDTGSREHGNSWRPTSFGQGRRCAYGWNLT